MLKSFYLCHFFVAFYYPLKMGRISGKMNKRIEKFSRIFSKIVET
jgi:hypothetical protein